MDDTATKKKSVQPALTPDEAIELTKHLTLENHVYIMGRSEEQGMHPSEVLHNIIDTSRRFYRCPVGKRHV